MNFTSAIITIEELAKVDPAVSVCVDVQVRMLFYCCIELTFAHRTLWSIMASCGMAPRNSRKNGFLAWQREQWAVSV